MQCISCEANIPPEWVNAIQTNICPGCGKEIMNEEQKNLRDEIAAAMEQMSHNPDGLAGWLLSNYHLRKVGEAEPTHFHRAKNKNRKDSDEISEDTNENIATQEFLQRTDVASRLKNRKSLNELKESAMRIMNNSPPINTEIEEDEENFEDTEEEELEPEIAAAMRVSQMQQKNKKNNSSVVINAVNAIKSSQTSTGEIHPELIRARMAALQKQKNALSGGGGSFRRV